MREAEPDSPVLPVPKKVACEPIEEVDSDSDGEVDEVDGRIPSTLIAGHQPRTDSQELASQFGRLKLNSQVREVGSQQIKQLFDSQEEPQMFSRKKLPHPRATISPRFTTASISPMKFVPKVPPLKPSAFTSFSRPA